MKMTGCRGADLVRSWRGQRSSLNAASGGGRSEHLDAICYDIPVESGRIIIVLEPLFRE
jgi:hypothetical protein